MNKQQAIEFIENNSIVRQWNEEKLQEAIEVLKKPTTLAEFLGWEENTEYEVNDVIYKISENVFFSRLNNSSYGFSEAYFDVDILEELRQAKKVGLKKYYLKHKFLGIFNDRNYLKHAICDDDSIFILSDKYQTKIMKTQFTLKEIEEIKKEYNTDLKDFDLIEVEDEK